MASLISNAQKSSIDSALSLLHDTFSIEIYAYIEKSESVVSDLNYNAVYGSSKNQSIASFNKTLIKEAIQARVKFFTNQEENTLPANLSESKGLVRIKISKEDYEKIKICTKIQIREAFYTVDGDADIEGIFSDNYYTIYLRREN
jgi:hypothetical protein